MANHITGSGATLTLDSSGQDVVGYDTIFDVVTISWGAISVPAVEDNVLASAGQSKYIPGDLSEVDTLTVRAAFDTKAGCDRPGQKYDLITVTYPKADTTSALPATVVGSGFMEQFTPFDSLDHNVRVEAEFVFRFDGQTAIQFSKEAATLQQFPIYPPGDPDA